ncbi:MAG: hypothetical protein ACE3JQ_05970 [Paenisporosarcina sp.]
MSNDNWSKQKIEQLLSQVPKMNDVRSKEEIFNRLKEEQLKVQSSPKKQRYWAPPAVAVAALLTLTLLTVSFLNQPNRSNESAKLMDSENAEGKMDAQRDPNTIQNTVAEDQQRTYKGGEEDGTSLTSFASETFGTSVYPNEISDDVTVFRLGLAGDAANSVPVTFLIPKNQIEEDFGDIVPTSLELYQMYASRLDEEALGFSDYHPYKGSFATEGDSLIHLLPKDHGYDIGSGNLDVYKGSLKDTFSDYKQIMFKTVDGSPIVFDQEGEPSKPMDLNGIVNHYNYYLYHQTNGNAYLSPNFGLTFKSIEDALLQMKENQNDIFTSVIPEKVTFEVKSQNDITRVIFTEPLDLEQMDSTTAMNMIEGMLLTGASFGQQLQFENVKQANWNNFDFTNPLPIPLGANKMQLILNQ